MITLNRPSILLLIPLLSFSAVPAIAAPTQQEQLDQSRTQESERQERRNQKRAEIVAPPPPFSDLPADESVSFPCTAIGEVEDDCLKPPIHYLIHDYFGKNALALHNFNNISFAISP